MEVSECSINSCFTPYNECMINDIPKSDINNVEGYVERFKDKGLVVFENILDINNVMDVKRDIETSTTSIDIDHVSVAKIAHCDIIKSVIMNLSHNKQFKMFHHMYSRKIKTDEFTDIHTDYYRFMNSGSRVCTVWIPITKQYMNEGTIGFIPGTHLLDFNEKIEGLELPKDYIKIRDSSEWQTFHFSPGDCVFFDSRCIHGSFVNKSKETRLSMDIRYSL